MRAALSALALAVLIGGCGADAASTGTADPAPPPLSTTGVATTSGAERGADGDPMVQVVRPTALRSAPGGRTVARLGTRTEYGTTRYLPVVRRAGGWLGVIATQRPNGTVGWIRRADTRPALTRSRISVDLSERRLVLVDLDGRTLLRFTVGVGAAATPTPTGRFAVTDGLRAPVGSGYGCCILALSGHQPNVPQGWTGGDRLAIHGTNDPESIGFPASHGCLRASDADLRRLMDRVGLGTIVEIRA